MTLAGRRARREQRRQDRDHHAYAADLAARWRWVAEGTAIAREVPCVAGGIVSSVPPVVAVELGGGPPVLMVRLLAGQLADDIAAEARRLAEGMGVACVWVEPWRHGFARVTLLAIDPLAGHPVVGANRVSEMFPIHLGCGENGLSVGLDLATAAHLVVQGATRSGKSTALYGILAQLAGLDAVLVTGCDPSGLLMAPWVARSGSFPPSVGTGNPVAHVAVLEALTAEMDKRILAIPSGRDTVDLGPELPLVVCLIDR